jgi:hypothetical protein
MLLHRRHIKFIDKQIYLFFVANDTLGTPRCMIIRRRRIDGTKWRRMSTRRPPIDKGIASSRLLRRSCHQKQTATSDIIGRIDVTSCASQCRRASTSQAVCFSFQVNAHSSTNPKLATHVPFLYESFT